MYGLPKEIDPSFFVGKILNVVSFTSNTINLIFDDKVAITLYSSYQQQSKFDVEHHLLGSAQSVFKIQSSSLMQFCGHAVISAVANEDGTLALTFDDGNVMNCIEDPGPYECYEFTDGQNTWIV